MCNVLFTRELQRRLDKDGTGIKVNCFSPGLIVGTGLFRDQNPIFTKVSSVLIDLKDFKTIYSSFWFACVCL